MPDGNFFDQFDPGATPAPDVLDAEVNRVGQKYDVPPELIHSVIHQESGGNPRAVSYQGAAGLMQLEPETAASLGVSNLFDWSQSLDAGTRYLKQGLDRYGGRPDLAAAYYHGGPDEEQWGPKTANYADAVMSAYQRRTAQRPAPATNSFDQFDTSKGNAFDQFDGGQQSIAPVQRTWDTPTESEDDENRHINGRTLPRAPTEDVPVDETKLAPWQTRTPPVADEIAPTLAKTPLEDRMTPQPGAAPTPAGDQPATSPGAGGRLGRIGSAIAEAWKSSPGILTPKAQAWLDQTGLGGVTRLADIALAAPNAVFAGLEQGAVETGQATGHPAAGRGAAEMLEYLTGPAMADLPGMRVPVEREPVSRETPAAAPTPVLDALAKQANPNIPEAAPVTPEQRAMAELDTIATGKPVPPAAAEVSGATPMEALPQEPAGGLKPVLDDQGQWIGYERAEEPAAAVPPAPVAPEPAVAPPVPEPPAPTNVFDQFDEKGPPNVENVGPGKSNVAASGRAGAGVKAPVADTPFETIPKEPERLSTFLRRMGGVQDVGGDIRSSLGGSKYRPGLINKSGLPLDEAALRAGESGYFPELSGERPSINDLREALHDDLNGRPVYSHQDEGALAAYHEATERNTEIDRLSDERGIPAQGKTRAQFFDALADRMSQDEMAAEAESQAAAHADEYAAAEKAAKAWVAYHGTPHDFDQFDLSKIGTGEGAQAYGHGLYFAENPEVSASYRKRLSNPPSTPANDIARSWLEDAGGDPEKAVSMFTDFARSAALQPDAIAETVGSIRANANNGHHLQVRLHAKPEEMLDWDKPLSEQPPNVRDFAARLGIADATMKGSEIYDRIAELTRVGEPEETASADLRQAGIKGIRYLDRGSRNAGEGSRNVVMLDPRDIEITHRNGEPVAPEAWNAQHFYGQSQARTLEDLEREHREASPTPAALELAARGEEPGPAGGNPPAVPQRGEPRGGGAGTGRGDEAQTDLLGRQAPAPRAPRVAEPTIRTDAQQDLIPGTEPSAVQAQAARDAQGRGALQADVMQKPANEGLFAPDTSSQGRLYSFPGALFDPDAWRRMFGTLDREARQPGFEIMADKKGLSRYSADIRRGLAPTSFRGAKPMEYTLRRYTSEKAQAADQAGHALERWRVATDRLSPTAQDEFTDRMERGTPQPTPELQKVADTLRGLLDDWAEKVQSLGKGYLANAIENYMGHIWGNYAEWAARRENSLTPTEMQDIASARLARKQPLRGSGSFLKQRSFPTQLEGIQAGLEPVTHNPVDLQMMKIHEMQKFYYGTRLADQIKQSRMATWIAATAEAEADARLNGWQPLDDTIFKPRIMGQNNEAGFGRLEPGNYWAPEPIARVFNNYMSQGWAGRSPIYDAIRAGNNALNTMQLGASGFHATFVTADTTISKMALGLQQLSRGHPIRGLGNIALGSAPLAPFTVAQTALRGGALRRAWLNPENLSPDMARILDALKTGGGTAAQSRIYQTGASGAFFKSIADFKNPLSPFYQTARDFQDAKGPYEKAVMVPMKLAGRLLDTVQQPLMGALVPRVKLGVFHDMASDWLRDHPDATTEETSAAMTKFWDSVENRLGQLNYDNLFWSKTAKDLAFITTRSVGWNLGTIREIGGAFVDSGSALKAIAHGKAPQLTTRMAYSMALPVVTAQIGAILTYLATGQGPQSMLDYFYPPTGGQDQGGRQDRRSIPGYMKDVIAFGHDPQGTMLNKTAPMLEALNELRTNRDYYGGIIYDPERDKGPAQAYGDFLINQATPFSFRSYNRLQGEGAPGLDQALSFWGFQAAPKSITEPQRGEAFQQRQNLKAYRARNKEPGHISILNAP